MLDFTYTCDEVDIAELEACVNLACALAGLNKAALVQRTSTISDEPKAVLRSWSREQLTEEIMYNEVLDVHML